MVAVFLIELGHLQDALVGCAVGFDICFTGEIIQRYVQYVGNIAGHFNRGQQWNLGIKL